MNSYDDSRGSATDVLPSLGRYEVAERTFFHRVFGWMGGGLLLTALVAWYFGQSARFESLFVRHRGVLLVLVLAQFGLLFGINRSIRKLSESWAASLFVTYSALTGVTLSWIFMAYTSGSIVSTFVASGGTFAAAGIYGAVTKKDLTTMGRLLFFALIGLIIATIVNLFLGSSGLSWAISYAGVFIFIGLTAYDIQKLKGWHRHGIENTAEDRALAVGGALMLYLDFLNLFIFMLQILGKRRD